MNIKREFTKNLGLYAVKKKRKLDSKNRYSCFITGKTPFYNASQMALNLMQEKIDRELKNGPVKSISIEQYLKEKELKNDQKT